MVQNHLARYAAPKHWALERKEHHWTARPKAGPHKISESLTINLLLKELLQSAKTTKEVNYILNNGWIHIDKTVRKDFKFPVGFMDVIEVTKTNEAYRLIYDKKGRLSLLAIPQAETTKKILKIVGKTIVKKGKTQLNLSDGRNLLLDSFKGSVGDGVVYDLKEHKILHHIPLKEGTLVYITAGKHLGEQATIKNIIRTTGLEQTKVTLQAGETTFITLIEYALPIGTDKPLISLEAKQ